MIGRFGSPGPREFRESNLETEIKNPTQAAFRILLSGFAVVLIAEFVLIVFHDVALPLVGMLISGLVGLSLCLFVGMDRSWAGLISVFFAFIGGTFVIANTETIWARVDSGFVLLGQVVVLFFVPITPLVVVVGLLVWGIVSRIFGFKIGTALTIVGLIVFCVWNRDPWTYSYLSDSWRILRWFALPWVLPPVVAAVIMILTMAKEMVFPALEHALVPLKWEDYLDAGGRPWNLYLPIKEKPEIVEVEPKGEIDVTIYTKRTDAPEMKRSTLPFPKKTGRDGLYSFAQDILFGFAYWSRDGSQKDSIHGARDYGFSQSEWNVLSQEFLRLGFSVADGRGTNLTEEGYGFLAGMAARHFGRDAVPEQYLQYLGGFDGKD